MKFGILESSNFCVFLASVFLLLKIEEFRNNCDQINHNNNGISPSLFTNKFNHRIQVSYSIGDIKADKKRKLSNEIKDNKDLSTCFPETSLETPSVSFAKFDVRTSGVDTIVLLSFVDIN